MDVVSIFSQVLIAAIAAVILLGLLGWGYTFWRSRRVRAQRASAAPVVTQAPTVPMVQEPIFLTRYKPPRSTLTTRMDLELDMVEPRLT